MAGVSDIFSRAIQKVGGTSLSTISITSVTKANPGVVTYTGADFTDGDIIYINEVGGMTELNGNFYQVGSINTSSNTFNLLDRYSGSNVNTTSYTTYTSGGTVLRRTGMDNYFDAVYRVYANARDSELRAHNWNFAIKRTSIAATEIVITGITAAEPPVVSYTGADPANGDRVYIDEVVGMTEVNGNYYRVADVNTTANTFELTDESTGDDIDGTTFTAYSSVGIFIVVPYYGWNRKYTLPSDFIRLVEVDGMVGITSNLGGLGSSNDYSMEGGYIVCNDSGPLFIRYIHQSTTVNDWDMMFRESLACRIAIEISTEIKQSDSNKDLLLKEYKMIITQAKLADSIETPGEVLPVSDWLLARY